MVYFLCRIQRPGQGAYVHVEAHPNRSVLAQEGNEAGGDPKAHY